MIPIRAWLSNNIRSLFTKMGNLHSSFSHWFTFTTKSLLYKSCGQTWLLRWSMISKQTGRTEFINMIKIRVDVEMHRNFPVWKISANLYAIPKRSWVAGKLELSQTYLSRQYNCNQPISSHFRLTKQNLKIFDFLLPFIVPLHEQNSHIIVGEFNHVPNLPLGVLDLTNI